MLLEEEPRVGRGKVDEVQQQLDSFVEVRSRDLPGLEAAAEALLVQDNNVKHWQSSIASSKRELQQSTRLKDAAEEQVNEITSSAAESCPDRPETSKPASFYDRQIEAIQRQLSAAESGDTIETATARYEAAKASFYSVKAELDDFKALVRALRQSMALRRLNWLFMRSHSAIRAKGRFTQNLRTRGYDGSLVFLHSAGKMRMVVHTDGQESVDSGEWLNQPRHRSPNDPTSLSGGEKSFSTIALLLALWDVIGS